MPPSDEGSQGAGAARPPQNMVALLGLAHSALGHQIVAGVVEAGFPQRPAHSNVFAHVDIEGGTRLTELARRANITPQAMGELVDDLERMGYVSRRADPEDRRAKRIVLTRRGLACVQAALQTIASIEDRLKALLGESGLLALRSTLERIIAVGELADRPHDARA
jgi:DNA-binding MarR family transcriptional regulator